MLKGSVNHSRPKGNQQNMGIVDWVAIESEWAYWVDPESFSFKHVKKRAPVGTVIVLKSRETLDDEERTYVKSSLGIVGETGIVALKKKDASDTLAKQALDYMRWKKRWPPFTSMKRVLNSGDVEVYYEPTEYDSFVLPLTKEMVGEDPSDFLSRLKKHETPKEPLWKVETAKSGRSKCRTCKDVILERRLRIGEPYFYEEKLSYRWHHPRCVAKRIDASEIEKLDGYDFLKSEDRQRLKRLLAN